MGGFKGGNVGDKVTESEVDVVKVVAPGRSRGGGYDRAGVARGLGGVDLEPGYAVGTLTSCCVQLRIGDPGDGAGLPVATANYLPLRHLW